MFRPYDIEGLIIEWQIGGVALTTVDKVREAGVRGDTTCSFFGRDVRVSTNRGS